MRIFYLPSVRSPIIPQTIKLIRVGKRFIIIKTRKKSAREKGVISSVHGKLCESRCCSISATQAPGGSKPRKTFAKQSSLENELPLTLPISLLMRSIARHSGISRSIRSRVRISTNAAGCKELSAMYNTAQWAYHWDYRSCLAYSEISSAKERYILSIYIIRYACLRDIYISRAVERH